MRRLALFLSLLLLYAAADAQKTTEIHLQRSDVLTRVSADVFRVIKPQFEHEGSVLTADSSDFNKTANTFDAFGNVVITQPNGTFIYGDQLNYNGNTRIAVLTNHVRLIDEKGAVLTTNLLTYNLSTRYGTYVNGGKIENKGDVLTSKNGYYFGTSNDSYFRYDVVVTTKDAVVKSDTLRYNSAFRMAYFYGPTHIYGKQDTLYTELGDYNTETRQAHGRLNNLYQQNTKFLKGDSIFYDDANGYGDARRNVVFTDTGPQKIMLFGEHGVYNRLDTSAVLTEYPYAIFVIQDSAKVDSAYMTADTLYTKLIQKRNFKRLDLARLIFEADQSATAVVSDAAQVAALKKTKAALAKELPEKTSPPKKQKKKKKKKGEPDADEAAPKIDSAATSAADLKTGITLKKVRTAAQIRDSIRRDSLTRDSLVFANDTTRTRIVLAYHHVKIFKSDLQSTSDSVFYSYQDSVIRSYKKPVVWSQGSQMSADTIYMQLRNRQIDRMLFQRNGFIVSTERDSTNFNQVKGRTLIGYFKDSKMRRMYVNGNAESIYYVADSTGYTGMNHSEGSVSRITFENNEVSDITHLGKQQSSYAPIEQVKLKSLDGLNWRPQDRPKSKEEIIPTLAKGRRPPLRKPPATKPKTAPAKKPAVAPAKGTRGSAAKSSRP